MDVALLRAACGFWEGCINRELYGDARVSFRSRKDIWLEFTCNYFNVIQYLLYYVYCLRGMCVYFWNIGKRTYSPGRINVSLST